MAISIVGYRVVTAPLGAGGDVSDASTGDVPWGTPAVGDLVLTFGANADQVPAGSVAIHANHGIWYEEVASAAWPAVAFSDPYGYPPPSGSPPECKVVAQVALRGHHSASPIDSFDVGISAIEATPDVFYCELTPDATLTPRALAVGWLWAVAAEWILGSPPATGWNSISQPTVGRAYSRSIAALAVGQYRESALLVSTEVAVPGTPGTFTALYGASPGGGDIMFEALGAVVSVRAAEQSPEADVDSPGVDGAAYLGGPMAAAADASSPGVTGAAALTVRAAVLPALEALSPGVNGSASLGTRLALAMEVAGPGVDGAAGLFQSRAVAGEAEDPGVDGAAALWIRNLVSFDGEAEDPGVDGVADFGIVEKIPLPAAEVTAPGVDGTARMAVAGGTRWIRLTWRTGGRA